MPTNPESLASKVLVETNYQGGRVDVVRIANEYGIQVLGAELPVEVSGVLKTPPDGTPTIYVNKNQERQRKRFTVAHEIAHFLMDSTEGVHLDKQSLLNFRGTRRSPMETRADEFAAALLMPAESVVKEWDKTYSPELSLDDIVCALKKAFDVSFTAMSIRLQRLNLIHM